MGERRKENRQIKFRVNEQEFEKLEQIAKSFSMSVPTFCKKKAQGARMTPPKINLEGAREIASQLRAIGVNVNQLARKANEGSQIDRDVLEAIEKELHGLWQQFNSAIQK